MLRFVDRYIISIIFSLIILSYLINNAVPLIIFLAIFIKMIIRLWNHEIIIVLYIIVAACPGIINSIFSKIQVSGFLPTSLIILLLSSYMLAVACSRNATVPKNIFVAPFFIAILGSLIGLINANVRVLSEIQNHLPWILFPIIYLYAYNYLKFEELIESLSINLMGITFITLTSYLIIARAETRGLADLYDTGYNKIDLLINPLLPAILFLANITVLQGKFNIKNLFKSLVAFFLIIFTFSRSLIISAILVSFIYAIYRTKHLNTFLFINLIVVLAAAAYLNLQYFTPLFSERIDSALYRQIILSVMSNFFLKQASTLELIFGLGFGATVPLDLAYRFSDSPAYWIEIEILKIGYNTGVVGVLLYIYFFIKTIAITLMRRSSSLNNFYILVLLTTFISSIFSGQIMSPLFSVVYVIIHLSLARQHCSKQGIAYAKK